MSKGVPAMPPEHVPLWVTVVALIVLPVAGWASKGLKEALQSRVDERLGLTKAQQEYARGLADRVQILEDRLERMSAQHRAEVEEIRRAYQKQIKTIRDHYETRIAHLERLVDGRPSHEQTSPPG